MTAETTLSEMPLEFDPFSDEYFNGPYDLYRRMRDDAPVYFNEKYGFWALFRYDDVCAAHKDWQTFSSAHGVDLSTLHTDPDIIRMYRSIIMMDPPDHDRLRALVSRVFTPKAVTALEPMVREVIVSFLAPFDDADSFDAVADFSGPFPVEIISRMLGVPAEDRQQIRHWLDIGLHREPGQMDPTPEGIEAQMQSGMYWMALTEEKRRNPADDMLSRLTQVEVDRGDGEMTRLDDAGDRRVRRPARWGGRRDGDQAGGQRRLPVPQEPRPVRQGPSTTRRRSLGRRGDPALLPPSQYQGRYSVRESTYSGVTIPPGHPTILITGSATRDERFYDEPDVFNVDRKPTLALGLGYGIHSCLGAALARVESRVAVQELIKRWPSFEVDEDGLARVQMSNVAGYSNVPVHRTA